MRVFFAKALHTLLFVAPAILVACGSGSSTSNSVAVAPLATERGNHTASLLQSGKVLVVGGRSNTAVLASTELYDPATDSWTSASSLAAARFAHTATLMHDGKVLVVGGYASSGMLASAELYDPANNSWVSAGNLTTARTVHSATLLLDGKVLVVGGATYGYFLNSAEIYDPVTNTWSSAGVLATARDAHTANLLPTGQVLVAGGYGASGSMPAVGSSLANCELYDPTSNTWATVANSLAQSRFAHTATLLPSGKVMVAGGFKTANVGVLSSLRTSLASSELYDPENGTWTTVANFVTSRGSHTSTLLLNGSLMIIGGSENTSLGSVDQVLGSTELYDTSSDSWTATRNLANKRALHTATRISNGTVLVVGGADANGYTASVEIIDAGG